MNVNLTLSFVLGLIVLVLLWGLSLSYGPVSIPVEAIWARLWGEDFPRSSWETIIVEYRLPKSITAILVGINLSISGLQMQTYFRNPLAGPYVLGVSSGAGLGVAITLMAGTALGWNLWGMTDGWVLFLAAALGAIGVLAIVSFTAWRVKDSMTLLIVGLMFGSLASALVALLSYFAAAEKLKMYTVWSLGSLGATTWPQLQLFGWATLIGLIPVFLVAKSFNAMLLGENYAQSLGINVGRLKWTMIVSTGLLTGSTTAFCGPIAFIGIAVPHIARLILKTTDHKILFPGAALLGAIILLACDSLSHLPGTASVLPINAITSLLGAPVVIWLIVRRNFSKEF
ncbi:iron ABC transporter permease [Pleomorphovibrio marinus]|uniref:iron ABC transporter permease n=1 Tax=Pleomorphovibrio marinus TaxID=2164132 RepID=UPI000E0ACF99|nr:iron ABC transporter permease [Pleomorphovibrio marinus]